MFSLCGKFNELFFNQANPKSWLLNQIYFIENSMFTFLLTWNLFNKIDVDL